MRKSTEFGVKVRQPCAIITLRLCQLHIIDVISPEILLILLLFFCFFLFSLSLSHVRLSSDTVSKGNTRLSAEIYG